LIKTGISNMFIFKDLRSTIYDRLIKIIIDEEADMKNIEHQH
jgi:hypothetical protein